MGRQQQPVLKQFKQLFMNDMWSMDEWTKPAIVFGRQPDTHVHLHFHKHTHVNGNHFQEVQHRSYIEHDGEYVDEDE